MTISTSYLWAILDPSSVHLLRGSDVAAQINVSYLNLDYLHLRQCLVAQLSYMYLAEWLHIRKAVNAQ